MKILVYLGSKMGNKKIFEQSVIEVADWIGKNSHDLIYGGNANGLMGVLANRVKYHNRKVTGIMPEFLIGEEIILEDIDEIIITKTMQERKDKMRELADVCIALPGGAGTMEEITEAFSLFIVNESKCPCILYNKENYYKPLKDMYDKMVENEFLDNSNRKKLLFSEDFNEIEKFILENIK